MWPLNELPLPLTVLLVRIIVPLLKMPPPSSEAAVAARGAVHKSQCTAVVNATALAAGVAAHGAVYKSQCTAVVNKAAEGGSC